MRDLYNNATVKALLSSKRQGHDATTLLTETGTTVDLDGEGRKCLLLVSVGATSTATLYIKVQESIDDSTWTTLYDKIFRSTGTTVVDLTPTKRYIRAQATLSATGILTALTYVDVAVGVVVYNERYRPSNVA